MLARQPTGRSFLRHDNSARVASESRNAKEPRIAELIHGLRHADKLAAQGHARCPHHQQKPLFMVRRNGYAQPGRMSWASVERSVCGTDFMATHLTACHGTQSKRVSRLRSESDCPARCIYGQRLAGGKTRDQDGRCAGWASHNSSTASTVWGRSPNEVRTRGGILLVKTGRTQFGLPRRSNSAPVAAHPFNRPVAEGRLGRGKRSRRSFGAATAGATFSPGLASSSPLLPLPSSAQKSHWFCYRQPFSGRLS